MERTEYKKIIIQWKEFEIPKTLPREISVSLEHDFIPKFP